MPETYGAYARRLRAQLSQRLGYNVGVREFAVLVGVGKSLVGRVESGEVLPAPKYSRMLAGIAGGDYDVLLALSGKEKEALEEILEASEDVREVVKLAAFLTEAEVRMLRTLAENLAAGIPPASRRSLVWRR